MENLLCAKLYNDIKKIQEIIKHLNGQSNEDIENIKENIDNLQSKLKSKEIISDCEPDNQSLNEFWLREY